MMTFGPGSGEGCLAETLAKVVRHLVIGSLIVSGQRRTQSPELGIGGGKEPRRTVIVHLTTSERGESGQEGGCLVALSVFDRIVQHGLVRVASAAEVGRHAIEPTERPQGAHGVVEVTDPLPLGE